MATTKKSAAKTPKSLPKAGKDPKGGLTDIGREFFEKTEGLHLKPGVQGKADTPEKMVRKGSFLRRHFANPPGPVVDDKGQPTRQALQAAAWGEPVPKNEGDEKKLAAKGSDLLEEYHRVKDGGKASAKKTPAEAPAKKATAKAPARKAQAKAPAKKAVKKQAPAKKDIAAKAPAKRPAAGTSAAKKA